MNEKPKEEKNQDDVFEELNKMENIFRKVVKIINELMDRTYENFSREKIEELKKIFRSKNETINKIIEKGIFLKFVHPFLFIQTDENKK